MTNSNALNLAIELISKPSVTPIDAGALDVVEARLTTLGFRCKRYPFGDGEARVDNLYARLGAVSYTHLTLPTKA